MVSDLERAGIAGIGLVIIRGLVALRIVGNREFAVILIVLHTISSRFMLPDMRGAGASIIRGKYGNSPKPKTVPG